MKYIVVLGDGMSDFPIESLNGKTPMEAANKKNMNALAEKSLCGLLQTVPENMSPGSDVANLSVMGYDPTVYHTGRSPLEAVSMGIELRAEDLTYRCNLVTLSDEENLKDCTMVDYSSGEISTEDAKALIEDLKKTLDSAGVTLYAGVSYRHCLVLNDAAEGAKLTPPHDISGKPVKGHLPTGQNSERLLSLMRASRTILKDHPVNQSRIERGLAPATCCWFWGEGRKPALKSFEELFGKKGSVVSAVDLIRGIGKCVGLRTPIVDGADATIHTNFEGKAKAAVDALLEGDDFVYVHIEAPDECGHHGNLVEKMRAIERIDEKIVDPLCRAMEEAGEDYAMLILPDHATPISTKTHARDPVPFLLYRSGTPIDSGVSNYCEASCKETGIFLEKGPDMMKKLFEN